MIKKSRPLRIDKFARVSSIMLHDRRLTTRDKMVMVALSEFQDPAGCCWPSIASLCKISGLGKTAVHEGLLVLESLGYIERQVRLSTSNYYRCSQLPINDLLDHDKDGNGEDGHVARSPSGGQGGSPSELWGGSESDLLVFDQRTGVLRLAETSPPLSEHKEEKEIEQLKDLWKEVLPLNPTGLEKPKIYKIFLFYKRHYGASAGVVKNLAEMVKKSKFLQGANERKWKASMFYCLKNREAILSGRYTDYRDKSGDEVFEVDFTQD